MDKKLIKALVVLFVISWVFGFLYYFLGGSRASIFFLIVGAIYMWIPGLVGIFYSRHEGLQMPYFRKPTWIYLIAGLVGLGISVVSFLLSIPFNDFNTEALGPLQIIYVLLASLVVGLTLNMIVALGEEIFWRGYLYEKLKKLSFLKITFFTGLLWGIWHAPFIAIGHNYPGYPILGTLFMILLTIGLSPILLYFRLRGKALMVSAALHGTLNGSAPLYFIFFQSPEPVFFGPTGLVGIVIIWILGLIFLNRLNKEFKPKK